MATYGQAVDLVISQLQRSDTSITSFVEQEIRNALEYYSSQRFWFNEARATFTTSSGQATYTGTTGILEIDSVVVTLGGSKYELEPMNYAVLNALDLGNVTGQPSRYAYWQESFRLYPVPNGSYTCAIEYQQRFATLSASTDTNAFLNYGLEMVVARVQKNMNATRYRDAASAQIQADVEERAFQRLLMQTDKLISTGRIVPD